MVSREITETGMPVVTDKHLSMILRDGLLDKPSAMGNLLELHALRKGKNPLVGGMIGAAAAGYRGREVVNPFETHLLNTYRMLSYAFRPESVPVVSEGTVARVGLLGLTDTVRVLTPTVESFKRQPGLFEYFGVYALPVMEARDGEGASGDLLRYAAIMYSCIQEENLKRSISGVSE